MKQEALCLSTNLLANVLRISTFLLTSVLSFKYMELAQGNFNFCPRLIQCYSLVCRPQRIVLYRNKTRNIQNNECLREDGPQDN